MVVKPVFQQDSSLPVRSASWTVHSRTQVHPSQVQSPRDTRGAQLWWHPGSPVYRKGSLCSVWRFTHSNSARGGGCSRHRLGPSGSVALENRWAAAAPDRVERRGRRQRGRGSRGRSLQGQGRPRPRMGAAAAAEKKRTVAVVWPGPANPGWPTPAERGGE